MPFANLAYASERREDRDDVHHRTRGTDEGGREFHLVVVNISPNGLMARCEAPPEPGTRLALRLPGLDAVRAEVRWALGGRIGCEFADAIVPAVYYTLLPRLT